MKLTKKAFWLVAIAFLVFFVVQKNVNKALAILQTNSAATFVVGQQNLTSSSENQGGSIRASTLYGPNFVSTSGSKVFVSDWFNNRVLIYNSIPTGSNPSADVVVGQQDKTHGVGNQGSGVLASTLSWPRSVFSDGTKLVISDQNNSRVLIFNAIPSTDNANANVVVGQTDKTHGAVNRSGAITANTLNLPTNACISGSKLIIADTSNNRVLIYNTIPTNDDASADVVIGQHNKTLGDGNQGGSVAEDTLSRPFGLFVYGSKLFIADTYNHRVLIYNSIPISDGVSANVVIGQQNMTGSTANQGTYVSANAFNSPTGVYYDGSKLFITDFGNNRVLVYNSIPTGSNASADYVIGQQNLTSSYSNQDTDVSANGLFNPYNLFVSGNKAFVSDYANNRVLAYDLYPTLAEVTPVLNPTSDTTPNYTFSSTEAGTITYGGDCSSGTTSATAGNNTVTFNALADGAHSNCTVTVTNAVGYPSSSLGLTAFTTDSAAPSVTNVVSGSTYSTDVTPTFSEGSATLNGVPFSSGTIVTEDGDYSLVITDGAGNVSTTQFTIQKISTDTPTLNYNGKKSAKKTVKLTFYGLSLSKIQKNWVTVRIGGKKTKVKKIAKTSTYLRVTVDLKYGRWAVGSYNLAMNYKTKVGKHMQKGSRSKNNILTIN